MRQVRGIVGGRMHMTRRVERRVGGIVLNDGIDRWSWYPDAGDSLYRYEGYIPGWGHADWYVLVRDNGRVWVLTVEEDRYGDNRIVAMPLHEVPYDAYQGIKCALEMMGIEA